MKCPFCSEEISEDASLCPACGETLKENVKIRINKKVLIISASLVFVLVMISGVTGVLLNLENKAFKEITLGFRIPEKNSIKSYNSLYDTLSEINTKEKNFKEYIGKKHLQKNKDAAFGEFYNMLLESATIFNDVNWSYDYEDQISHFNSTLTKGYPNIFGYVIERGIKVVPIMEKSEFGTDYIREVKITSPKVPYIKLTYSGEGLIGAEVDYNYLYETYSKHLGASWSDFLRQKAKEQKDMNGGAYYQDAALNPSMTNLTEWITAWQGFRKKYPKFMSDKIEDYLLHYTSDFMCNLYGTFDYDENLLPKAKEAYEEFLKKVNPNTKEYKAVNKCYSVLKEHNFKYTNEFSVCRSDWNNSDEYWEWR